MGVKHGVMLTEKKWKVLDNRVLRDVFEIGRKEGRDWRMESITQWEVL